MFVRVCVCVSSECEYFLQERIEESEDGTRYGHEHHHMKMNEKEKEKGEKKLEFLFIHYHILIQYIKLCRENTCEPLWRKVCDGERKRERESLLSCV